MRGVVGLRIAVLLPYCEDRPKEQCAEQGSDGVHEPIGRIARASRDEDLMEFVAYSVEACDERGERACFWQGQAQAQGVHEREPKQEELGEMPHRRHIDRMTEERVRCRAEGFEQEADDARIMIERIARFGAHAKDEKRNCRNERPAQDRDSCGRGALHHLTRFEEEEPDRSFVRGLSEEGVSLSNS